MVSVPPLVATVWPLVGAFALPEVLPVLAVSGGTACPSSAATTEAHVFTICEIVEENDLDLDHNQHTTNNEESKSS